MTTKEKIKKEIDTLPDEIIDQLYEFIRELKKNGKKRKKLRTFKLGGAFDNVNIREEAYGRDIR